MMLKTIHVACILFCVTFSMAVHADRPIVTHPADYLHDGVELQGYMAYPESQDADVSKRQLPGVLIIHEWWGLNHFAKQQAERLARLGYFAFALDMYGKGKVTDDPNVARQWSGPLYGNQAMRDRARAGLDILMSQPDVDRQRLAAIGYCFGGTGALQLAYDGAPIRAAVSFHGQPIAPKPDDLERIEATLLVCHGAADPLVKSETIMKFVETTRSLNTRVLWIDYPGAVHSFTNPGADAHGIEGVAYDENAAKLSWQDMLHVFDQTIGKPDE